MPFRTPTKQTGIQTMVMVGLAGFEPTTFTRTQRLAAPTGFSKTAPEFRHPMRSANPCLLSGARRPTLAGLQPHPVV